MLGGILSPIVTLMYDNTLKSWKVGEQLITATYQANTAHFSVIKNGITTLIPAHYVVGIPTVSCDLATWRAVLANTSAQLAALSNTYKLYITPQLLGGGNIVNDPQKIWPTSIIPYEVDINTYALDTDERRIIVEAIQAWNNANTGFTFVLRNVEKDFLFFGQHTHKSNTGTVGGDAWDDSAPTFPNGYQGGKHYLYCHSHDFHPDQTSHGQDPRLLFKREVMAYIGYALGLLAEHQRPDRDDFLQVTIPLHAYGVDHTADDMVFCETHRQYADTASVGPFDFASIMHPPLNRRYACGCSLSATSTFPGDGEAQVGYLDVLSPGDIATVKYVSQLSQHHAQRRKEGRHTFVVENQTSVLKEGDCFVEPPQWQLLRWKGRSHEQKKELNLAALYYLNLLSDYARLIEGEWQAHPSMVRMIGECQFACGRYYDEKDDQENAFLYYEKALDSLHLAIIKEEVILKADNPYEGTGMHGINDLRYFNTGISRQMMQIHDLMLQIKTRQAVDNKAHCIIQ